MSTTRSYPSHRPPRFRPFQGRTLTVAMAAGLAALVTLAAVPVQAQQAPMQRRLAQPPLFSMPASGARAAAVDINRDVRPALEAADLWIGLADINRAQQSWEQAAPVFQRAISADAWAKRLQAARAPLGRVKSRKTHDAVFTRSLPGQPDGEYVVIQYDTVFEHKAEAHEMVTMAFGVDGRWRVAGYLVR
ncbi:DUF4019 domain-containing protein [Pandoraea terrigena]|uniref:DUF4019 domain-containing protein n=1 Tax=Pandoraea terrigena TaxID=2508292 RepID=A0A5E4XAB0_9BURK|nr:DUF4019 domain-containing protein [Pandoraea terrigena]VVE33331.1 hypothetical protein PTE31013_03791 [Pandoraea terrigena]